MKEKIAIGRVSTTHGIHGDIRIVSFSGERDHFLSLKEVYLEKGGEERLQGLQYIKLHRDGLLAKFTGYDSPEAAGKLTGSVILTEREYACPLQEGEYYQADLLGCRVLFGGAEVGTVAATVECGPSELLEIITPGGKRLIPFNDAYIGEVRTEEKTVELKLDWLL
ncbi:MAG: 16S rRNA processing protein RimM [Spirochaetales bacterium]|nr:16S rRNA processing protein RimM [Spirochaetales bacterium]